MGWSIVGTIHGIGLLYSKHQYMQKLCGLICAGNQVGLRDQVLRFIGVGRGWEGWKGARSVVRVGRFMAGRFLKECQRWG
jgi:hypothetical protein